MSEPQSPDDNPYLASQVPDIATSVGDRKTLGTVAIIFAILLGVTTAVVTFCMTFFFTCLGLTGLVPGRGGWTSDAALPLSMLVGVVTAIAATWFAVWGFLKVVRAMKN